MKKKSGKKVVLSLLALLLLTITVGYAALSTTLNINGTSKINNATAAVPNIPNDNLLATPIVPEHHPAIHNAKIGANPIKK